MHAFEYFREVAHADLIAKSVNIVLYFLALGLQFPTFWPDAYIFIQAANHPKLFYILMWKLYNEIIKLYSCGLARERYNNLSHSRFILRSARLGIDSHCLHIL